MNGKILTGFHEMDEMTGGFSPAELAVIAGRPGRGTTSLTLDIALNAALRTKGKVLFVTPELLPEHVATRISRKELSCPPNLVVDGDVIFDATGKLQGWEEFADKCRHYVRDDDVRFIVIDCFQLLTSLGMARENAGRYVKSLARELEVPVLIEMKTNRACYHRDDHRPLLSDISWGAVQPFADYVFFIYRDSFHEAHMETWSFADDLINPYPHRKETTEIIIAVNKNRPVGTVRLVWHPRLMKFAEK